ncbi:MAG: NgoFVII family restriction endonuclease [Candidatus Hydrogenedentes bacterium]|nr:NgoFVII family restriction endonuclease [Candidatus Hydrogenedentota bacterium]
MPRIFDNIEETLLSALRDTLPLAKRGDFCVGYFNLRGWKQIDDQVDAWAGGDGQCCRLLVGMQKMPADELRTAMSLVDHGDKLDTQTALRLKRRLAEEFREQLAFGVPTDEDEAGLRRLAAQIKAGKVVVKLFLGHPLHAKLYLLFRPDPINPIVGYLGSSNLTFSGLRYQGELNIDVMDHDACTKLARWFEDRWTDRWCMDISKELVEIIETSWARVEPIPPYHIYLKIAYHLSQEARAGLSEFAIPRDFGAKLFEFQKAAVKIAAHHLNKRGGVLIGDVVGLGKTLMATAVARIMEDDHGLETLVICPKNLVPMWEDYREQYRMRAKVLSLSQVIRELPKLRRYRLILIDESHNLRNREGKRFRAIQEYVEGNESKCILLSATPYNKTYLDLSNQLRLFVKEDKDLGIRPEQLLKELGETEFIRRHQCAVRSLAAFEKSFYADDWRDLMRLYLVRRTRSFIQKNYAETDPASGRKFLTFEDGTRSYFPTRQPKTVKFKISDSAGEDQYARLYSSEVVDTINELTLPRYGLGNYLHASPRQPPSPTEQKTIQNLSRAGHRLKGFCRTGLFKRLESSGQAFMQSVERHILRNFVFLHAVERNLPLPIGTQDVGILDSRIFDEDADGDIGTAELFNDETEESDDIDAASGPLRSREDFKRRALEAYEEYARKYQKRFKWLRPDLFVPSLEKDLSADADALLSVIKNAGVWNPDQDAKLSKLLNLLLKLHPSEKVIVFTQFADTVRYLEAQIHAKGLKKAAGVTGASYDPAAMAWRFSPESNNKRSQVRPEDELRILIATDVLSEGQNLQDCAIVVNFDLPWAIIRLIQRVGRVDRIGQKAENIACYSFLPAEGVNKIIKLRDRLRQRLKENAEVVGTDESFFEDDRNDEAVLDLYNEKSGILDGETDTEVDLASYAYQIWKNAIDRNPELEKLIESLPAVAYSTKAHKPTEKEPHGVLVYMKTPEGNDALAWMNDKGESVTESQYQILKTAECLPETAALPRQPNHHDLVKKAVELIVAEEKTVGGQLGRPSGARFRTYERLKRHAEDVKGTLFESPELAKVIEEIYRYPLRQTAVDTLNRQLRSGISNEDLAGLAIALRQEERLCLVQVEDQAQEPRIICSLGLSETSVGT